jgi:hypothetical protein
MEDATLKGLRPTLWNRKPSQPFQGCEESLTDDDDPGFQGKHFHPTRAARMGTPVLG